MTNVDRWLLPDGIEDILPPRALAMEQVRRRLLDLYASWGYEYVIPPLVEFLESLLTGTGRDLDLKTFKVTDQLSGRTMGVRADMTPQVARIDSHGLNRAGQTRLCYAGTVLHSKADNMLTSRAPIKVGAELFGDSSRESDLEIVSMMVESLVKLGIANIHLELGDVSIFRHLMSLSDISRDEQENLFTLIQRKAFADLNNAISDLPLEKQLANLITQLPDLCGDHTVLDKSQQLFENHPVILDRLENLRWVADRVKQRFGDIDIYYDLSELRGYNYHTGIVFASYLRDSGQVIAKGGRYDDIGRVFGRSRAATGFDLLLTSLPESIIEFEPRQKIVWAGTVEETESRAGWQQIQSLREQGYIVIESSEQPSVYDLKLEHNMDQWQLLDRESIADRE